MFGAVGDALGRVFGTQKAVDNVLDKDTGLLAKLGGWIGDQQFTAQEKAEFAAKYLTALEPFKAAQRIMCAVVIVQWAILGQLIMLGIYLEACIEGFEVVKPLMELAKTEFMWYPIAAAVSLFLGGGLFNTFNKKR
jgi:hypothetical protein